MAKVIEEGNDLVLVLCWLEKIGAFHGNVRAPKSALLNSWAVDDPWVKGSALQGVRAPGTGIPFVTMLGTLRSRRGKDFAAVYGRGPAQVYEFEDQAFKRWVVSL